MHFWNIHWNGLACLQESSSSSTFPERNYHHRHGLNSISKDGNKGNDKLQEKQLFYTLRRVAVRKTIFVRLIFFTQQWTKYQQNVNVNVRMCTYGDGGGVWSKVNLILSYTGCFFIWIPLQLGTLPSFYVRFFWSTLSCLHKIMH